jgi:Transcriptional regulator
MSKVRESIATAPQSAKTARDKLIDAAVEMIAEHGEAGCSARRIGERAGIAASTINYTFGRIEHLFSSAYDHAAAAAKLWLDGQKCAILRLPASPVFAAFVLETLVLQWTEQARALALLYQECRSAKAPSAAGWSHAFAAFWEDVARHLTLPQGSAGLLHLQFEAEALYHLSRWDRLLETAVLRESCAYFARQWLGVAAEPAFGAIALATERLTSQPAWSASETAAGVALAASAVVGEAGLAGLTHRAAAAKAETTLGAVTYHFPTIESLVAGAVWGQVLEMTQGVQVMKTRRSISDDVRQPGIFPHVEAIAEARRKLFLAGIRRPDLITACATIRFAHGGTTRTMSSELEPVPDAQKAVHASVGSKLITTTALMKLDGVEPNIDGKLSLVLAGFTARR